MKFNWDMPASAMTAEEFLLVAVVQGLCAGLNYRSGVIVPGAELAEDALAIVRDVKEQCKREER